MIPALKHVLIRWLGFALALLALFALDSDPSLDATSILITCLALPALFVPRWCIDAYQKHYRPLEMQRYAVDPDRFASTEALRFRYYPRLSLRVSLLIACMVLATLALQLDTLALRHDWLSLLSLACGLGSLVCLLALIRLQAVTRNGPGYITVRPDRLEAPPSRWQSDAETVFFRSLERVQADKRRLELSGASRTLCIHREDMLSQEEFAKLKQLVRLRCYQNKGRVHDF